MKNLIKTGFAALVVTAINACCLQEAPDPPTGGGAITITAQTVQEQAVTNAPGTKTTLEEIVDGGETRWETHWIANTDKIGIFSPQAKATSEGTPAANPAKNLAFTAQASAKNSNFTGTIFWGSAEDHHFYAYYPRNTDFSGERTVVPVSLPWAQTQSAAGNSDHIGALDFMVATPATIAYQGAVNLSFNHVFTIIEFQVVGSGELTQISLTGAYPLACTGTIDLTQDPDINFYNITTSGTTKNVTVTLSTPVRLDPTVPVSVYMMVLPGIQDINMKIAVTTDGVWKEMEKNTPAVLHGFTRAISEPGFARGKKYVVSLDTSGPGWGSEFTDSRDANTYSYRLIGTQVWMTENLAYLPSVQASDLGSDSSPRYYVYNYERDNIIDAKITDEYIFYGVLYNWPAAMGGSTTSSANPSGVQGACPSGWHLPSDAEWTTLTTYLGGESVAGGKMKETGNIGAETGLWNGSNFGATNVSGFSGRPGGFRSYDVGFAEIGNYGYWWSSTAETDSAAWRRYLSYLYRDVDRYYTANRIGLSVRCIRD